jgi:hypothetical protein
VAVVYTAVPASLIIPADTNTTFYFITSAITNLDSASPLTDALNIYKNAVGNEANLLAEYHMEGEWRQKGEGK